jgi:ubiquinone/menaquinone biosynthesis C-methylase UbiE
MHMNARYENTGGDAQRVAGAFDAIADIFEISFENEITRELREIIYRTIRSLVPSGSAILDINCGTGIDARALVRQGYTVDGIDISPRMIRQAVHAAAVQDIARVQFNVSSFEKLPSSDGPKYDLVLSNFGGLNCVESLDAVAEEIARVTRPSGYFIAVVMPPFCTWEIAAGLCRGRVTDAFRRLRSNTQATGFSEKTFTVHYHTPGAMMRSLNRWFHSERCFGLNVITPPPHATNFKRKFSRLSRLLSGIENRIAHLPLLRAAGDHYVLTARRKNGAAA